MKTANYRCPISSSSSLLSWILFTLTIVACTVTSIAFDDQYAGYETYYQDSVFVEGSTTEENYTPVSATTETPSQDEAESIKNWYEYYCREDLCLQYDQFGQQVQKKHVACGHDGSFAEDCPPGRTLFRIDPQIKAFIIHLHNEARNRMANSSLPGFEGAVRMPTVEWSDELAELAELNTKSCKFQHDECRNTDEYRQAGQNLAIGYYPVGEDIFDVLEKLTMLWFDEYKDANQAVMDAFENLPNVTIGHFTQMMSDRTTKIGCGIVIYPQKVSGFTFTVVLYACNYSLTSIFSQPVYRKGTPAAECKHGINYHYNALCNVEENHWIRSVPSYDDSQK